MSIPVYEKLSGSAEVPSELRFQSHVNDQRFLATRADAVRTGHDHHIYHQLKTSIWTAALKWLSAPGDEDPA